MLCVLAMWPTGCSQQPAGQMTPSPCVYEPVGCRLNRALVSGQTVRRQSSRSGEASVDLPCPLVSTALSRFDPDRLLVPHPLLLFLYSLSPPSSSLSTPQSSSISISCSSPSNSQGKRDSLCPYDQYEYCCSTATHVCQHLTLHSLQVCSFI